MADNGPSIARQVGNSLNTPVYGVGAPIETRGQAYGAVSNTSMLSVGGNTFVSSVDSALHPTLKKP